MSTGAMVSWIEGGFRKHQLEIRFGTVDFFRNAALLVTNSSVRNHYVNWKGRKLITGKAPFIRMAGGNRLYPADRFNDYVSIAVQHPGEEEKRLMDDLFAESGGGGFLDVGANVGAMSLLAYGTGRTSSILAFEPSHRYCEAWHRNMTANKVANATLFETAVGDSNGTVEFRVDPRLPLNGKIDVGKVHFSTITQRVRIVTLDSILRTKDLQRVAVLKIDVEGAEPLVMRGAQKTLQCGQVRAILFEFIVEFM
jgi:FkbM family methyltransferase